MRKLTYIVLGFIGTMGTLSIGVANATTTVSEPYGKIDYTLNKNEYFTSQVITITDGTAMITMMDRNLGATTAGTGCDYYSNGEKLCDVDSTYGYYFQRGNNYGFNPTDSSIFINSRPVSTNGAIWYDNIYNNSGYYGTTLIKGDNSHGYDYWIDSINGPNHYDLWGGDFEDSNFTSLDDFNSEKRKVTNAPQRQGPCPEGFHIPSFGEWMKVLLMAGLLDDSSSEFDLIHNWLMIPFAGSFSYDSGYPQWFGMIGHGWLSSPSGQSSPKSFTFILRADGGVGVDEQYRAGALPMRCFYNLYQAFPETLSLSFMSGDVEVWSGEVESGSVYVDVPGENSTNPIPNMTMEGYDFDGWFLEGATEAFNFSTPITDNLTLHAQWTPIEYAIIFVDESGINEPEVHSGAYLSDTSNITFPLWNKEGYTIIWGKEIPAKMPLNGDIIIASWIKNETFGGGSSSGGGGGRSSSNNTSIEQNDDTSVGIDKNNDINGNEKDSGATEGQKYTEEFRQAYEFAYKNGITTMDSIDNANMEGKVTRIAMAKMLSQYAINVLGKKPANIVVPKFKDITEKMDEDYDNGVTLAYQLGIMGINMPNDKFRPDDYVTRAEFATALSRMLYSTPDGDLYYVPHIEKLKTEGIITNDNYKMEELRGYVMIMLMRSVKD